jgi:ATP-dependent Clp protease ATP-binding subunit ClpX
MPEDLLKFGLIPEFVGRLPVIATLDALDEDALVRILVEPKNALVRQYQKFFKMDMIDLEFDPEGLRAIAQQAMKRKTGARGLRAIIEDIMLDVMYDIPSRGDVLKCLVTKDTVLDRQAPLIVPRKRKKEETA